jgi:hypothetical protein
MTWHNDIYYYSSGILKAIAQGYDSLYEDGLLLANHRISYLHSIAEYKADFDMSLDYIGRGNWHGLISLDFRDYRYFGKLQRIIIADILGIVGLETWGFYDIPKLRGIAYFRMVEYLNSFERRPYQS